MEKDIFQECQQINMLVESNEENEARDILIQLLDYHEENKLPYSELVNHLIVRTGLYPYLMFETASWKDQFVYEAFKTNTGERESLTLHREQSSLLKKLVNGESIAVSAPTSFGKSFVIDAFIALNKPNNVVIIVPTIALTDETRRRLYKKFAKKYKIITTTDVELAERNIFIFPQERAINYVDKLDSIDILVIDEFYKASGKFDADRAPMLIKAILQLGQVAKQKYFLAPNIKTLEANPFTEGMEFYPLEFNTVYLEKYPLYETFNGDEKLKSDALIGILNRKKTKTLIYAGTFSNIEQVTNLLLTSHQELGNPVLEEFAKWLGMNYSYNWSLTKLIQRGTGIHNGKMHRSLSQIQIKLFEFDEGLENIISTSSIIEGVNTSAENVVIWANRSGKGNARLKDFTYKNIMGRGGRMFKHFVGKIFILDDPPKQEDTSLIIPFPEEILGDLDKDSFEQQLTKEQHAKIILYNEEMNDIFGEEVWNSIKRDHTFQISDAEVLKDITIDMKRNPNTWNGLGYLNSTDVSKWDHALYKIINADRKGWGDRFSTIVEFTKILKDNWRKSIPELLKDLEPFDVGIDKFFQLERVVSFKLSALASDINVLQQHLLTEKNYDISRFVSWASHAFLPPLMYQLEEYGLPRMISKKIHNSRIINMLDPDLTLHMAIDLFNDLGSEVIKNNVGLQGFENNIIDYFYEGLETY